MIITNGTKHPEALECWMGDSRGHWEGNVLVVSVADFIGDTWFDEAGSFHTAALHMVERFTIVDGNNIDYEATVEDPNVFTQPRKLAFGVWARAPEGYENYDYACHEGNRSLELTEVLFDDAPK